MSFIMAEPVASSSRDNTTTSPKMKCSFTLRSRNQNWIKTGRVNCAVIDSKTPFEDCLELSGDQKQVLGSYRGTNTDIQVPKDFKLVSRNHIAFIASQDQLYLYEDKAKYGVALDGVIAMQGVLYPVEVGSRVTLSPNCKASGTAFNFVVEEIRFVEVKVDFNRFVREYSPIDTTDDVQDTFEGPSNANNSIDLERDEGIITIDLEDDDDDEDVEEEIHRIMDNASRPSVSRRASIFDTAPDLSTLVQSQIGNIAKATERYYSEEHDFFEIDKEEEEEEEEGEEEEEEEGEEEDEEEEEGEIEEEEEEEEETSSSTSVVEETSTSTVETTSTPIVQATPVVKATPVVQTSAPVVTATVEATPVAQATPVPTPAVQATAVQTSAVETTSTAVQTTTYESQTPEEVEIPAQLPQSRKRTRDEYERNEDEDVDTHPAKKSTSGSRLGQIFTAVAAGMLVGSIGTVTALASMST